MPGLRLKISLSFTVLFLLLAAVAGLGLAMTGRLAFSVDTAYRENMASMQACQDMRLLAVRMRSHGGDSAYAGLPEDMAAFDAKLRFQAGNITVAGEKAATDSLAASWTGLAADLRGHPRPAETDPRFDALDSLLVRIHDLNNGNILSIDYAVKSRAADTRRFIAMLLGFGGFLLLAMLLLTGRLLFRPIRDLLASAREIEKGNLDFRLDVRSKDELGALAEAFNAMVQRLKAFRESDQARLVRTQRTTQLAIDSLPDAVAVLAPDGKVELCNGTARELFGLRPGEPALGPDRGWLEGPLRSVVEDGEGYHPQSYDRAIQAFRNGEERFFLPNLIPLRGEDRGLGGITLVLADVTGLRKLDEAKSDLLATVSHEFKTRLTSARMAVHLLLDARTGGLNARQADLLATAREDVEQLHRMIANLLDQGRLRAGRPNPEARPMATSEVIGPSLFAVQRDFEAKGVQLEADWGGDRPDVLADPLRVRLILDNLLSNALKFTPAGGTVAVETGEDREWVTVRVSDSGPGIPAEDLPRIFERYFRGAQDAAGESEGGAGLGLAIAKEVVEAHGGRITAISKPGKGTRFEFTLRRADARTG